MSEDAVLREVVLHDVKLHDASSEAVIAGSAMSESTTFSDPSTLVPQELAIVGGLICYDAARVAHPGDALFDPRNPALKARPVGQGGRNAAWYVEGDFGRGVLRHYRRGGAVARISKDRYLWRGKRATRAMAEFEVLAAMYSHGLPVPRPLAAAFWRSGITYRAAILVERIDDVTTLAELVQQQPVADDAVCQQVAHAILALHDGGFWHADLNAYNILLDCNRRAWLIDFDKAVVGPVPASKRSANLNRLHRSLRKVSPDTAHVWWKGINAAYMVLQSAKTRTVQ